MIQTFYSYCMGLSAVGSYILGLFVFLQKPGNVLYKAWFYFCCSVGTWALGYFLTMLPNTPKDTALVFSRVSHASGALIPALFLGYISIWLGIKKGLRFISRVCYILCGIFSVFSLTSLIVIDLAPKLSFNFYPVGRLGYLLYVINFVSWVVVAHYYMFKNYKIISGYKRNQMKYFLVGTSLGYFGGASCFPLIFNIKIPPYPSVLIFVYILTTTYAILKYHLMDIRLALTRASIFIFVYTFVLGIPFALGLWFRPVLSWIAGGIWWLLPMVVMAILATTGPFVYIYLDKRAEQRLLKEQRRYQDTLKQASLGMTMIKDIKKLLNLIVYIISRSVRIRYAGVYLLDKENNAYNLSASRGEGAKPAISISADNLLIRELIAGEKPLLLEEIKQHIQDGFGADLDNLRIEFMALGASVVVPCLIEDTLLGFMVLGDKRSGEIYTKDDLEVFTVLANQAALAIENARFFAESKEMQDQISQAEKMATIGTMADGLSHQINNRFHALSLISGDVLDSISLADTVDYSIEQKELLGEIKYGLERIQDNVIQGGEVVKGMLKYTRKGDAGFGQVSLDEILDATLDMVKYKIKLSEIDIIRDYPKDIPKVQGNLTQLQEVFFNLIDNAYDAAMERKQALKEPGYRARVRITTEYNNNVMLKISIEDNGMGVKDEDYNKLFTPFFTTKVSSRKGTGLGLYVIKKIIADNHKGRIAVESNYKQGTKFRLELPVEELSGVNLN